MLNLIGRDIVYEPTLDPWVLGGLGLSALVLSVSQYWRERPTFGTLSWFVLLSLRLGGILILVAILARPMCEERPEGKVQKSLAVLVDTSRSMNVHDAGDRSRLAAAREDVLRDANLWDALQRDHVLRFYEFAEEARPEALGQLMKRDKADGAATDLGGSLLAALNLGVASDESLSGVLILSDGRDNTGMDPELPAREAYARGVPIYALGLGTSQEVRDVALSSTTVEDFAFVGEETAVWANIYHRGFSGQTVKVDLYRDDAYVLSQQVSFGEQANCEVVFPVREEERGHRKFTVKVEPLPGESNPRNNEYNVYLNFIDETARVLLVEGHPHWDTKFLVQALRSDPTLAIDSIFQVNRSKYVSISTDAPATAEGVPLPESRFRYPVTREELFHYDVLIFGKGADSFFTPERVDLLREFLLDRGGSVVFCRGRSYDRPAEALARMEPVVWASGAIRNFRYRITEEGMETPIFEFENMQGQPTINQLPSLVSATRIQGEKSLAVVLARAVPEAYSAVQTEPELREMAVLAYQRYGRGKVMTVAGDGLWRWAFLPPRLARYDSIYAEFWGQVIRWMITGSEFLPGQDVTFRTSRKVYAPGEDVRLNILARGEIPDFRPRIEIIAPDHGVATVFPEPDSETPGLWTASFTPSTEGEHVAVLIGNQEPRRLETRFSCHFSSWEDQMVAANHDLLRRMCEASGGALLTMPELRRLPELLSAKTATIELAPRRNDIWDTRLLLYLLIGMFSLEWLGRRRLGVSQ